MIYNAMVKHFEIIDRKSTDLVPSYRSRASPTPAGVWLARKIAVNTSKAYWLRAQTSHSMTELRRLLFGHGSSDSPFYIINGWNRGWSSCTRTWLLLW